jgi:hypothetical protein
MEFPECSRYVHGVLEFFQMADSFRVEQDGEGIKVVKIAIGENHGSAASRAEPV